MKPACDCCKVCQNMCSDAFDSGSPCADDCQLSLFGDCVSYNNFMDGDMPEYCLLEVTNGEIQ